MALVENGGKEIAVDRRQGAARVASLGHKGARDHTDSQSKEDFAGEKSYRDRQDGRKH